MAREFVSLAGITGDYRVTLQDRDPLDVAVIGADVMRWEQINQRSFFEGTPSLSRIAFVCWAALRRTKQLDIPVEQFLRDVVDVEQSTPADDDAEDEAGAVLADPIEAGITA